MVRSFVASWKTINGKNLGMILVRFSHFWQKKGERGARCVRVEMGKIDVHKGVRKGGNMRRKRTRRRWKGSSSVRHIYIFLFMCVHNSWPHEEGHMKKNPRGWALSENHPRNLLLPSSRVYYRPFFSFSLSRSLSFSLFDDLDKSTLMYMSEWYIISSLFIKHIFQGVNVKFTWAFTAQFSLNAKIRTWHEYFSNILLL